jgi:hypothetical protein
MAREITGEFACEIHEEYGELGLRPAWMPNADPYSGMAVAHDLLEHLPGDDGGVEAEFQALGAAYWLRGESGYFGSRGWGNADPIANLSSDFVELYRHLAHEDFTLYAPPSTEPLEDESADENLRRIARDGCNLVREEESYSYDDKDEEDSELTAFCCTETQERIHGWLRIGYRRAVERFEGIDAFTLAQSVFAEIEKRADNWLKGTAEEGMVLAVRIDLDRLSVSMEAGYGVVEHEDCPDCDGGTVEGAPDWEDCERCKGGTARGSQHCKACDGEGCFNVAKREKCETCNGEGEIPPYREEI